MIARFMALSIALSACGATQREVEASPRNGAPPETTRAVASTEPAPATLPSGPPEIPADRAVVLPAARSDADVPSAAAALAAGDAEYRDAMLTPIEPDIDERTVAGWVGSFTRCVGRRRNHIERARRDYARDATAPADLAAAHVRRGDLFDALATAIGVSPMPVLIPYGPVVVDGIREFLSRHTAMTYCEALGAYREALAIDPANPRAQAQVAAYGEAFAAFCTPE